MKPSFLCAALVSCAGCGAAASPATGPPSAPPPAPGTETAALATPPPAASPSAIASAPESPTDVLARSRAAFDACYASARVANPNLGRTTVQITFTIDADGAPKAVDLQYRHRMDDRAKECLRDAALALKFPPSMQGTQSASIVLSPER
ncbi:MAG TPA: hypothetical protein VKU41_21785 [Polyangiaceae bacterium]|nr:hypothetical protein [Polyangiaceae bacterium]